MRVRGVIAVVAGVLVLLGVGAVLAWPASSGTPKPGRANLQITFSSPRGWAGLTVRLTCRPASGTIAHPGAACAEIARHPGMVFSSTGRDHSCPSSAGLTVRGTDAGRRVHVTFSPCLSGKEERGLERWARFLPGESEEDQVRLDRGLGLLSLGERSATVGSLLGAPEAVTDGLDVYEPWASLSGGCGGGVGGPFTQHAAIIGVRYNSAGRIITLLADSRQLTVDKREVPSLVLRCIHFGRETPKGPAELAAGPLRKWIPFSCGGLGALADHSLAGNTTAIVQSGDYPIVVVTSAPASACEDTATVRREWRVETHE